MCRSIILTLIASVAVWLPTAGVPAEATVPVQYDFRIEAQPLGQALQEFARQSGVQLIFFSEVTDGLESPALNGRFTAEAALERLLSGSELTAHSLNATTIEVRTRTGNDRPEPPPAPAGTVEAPPSGNGNLAQANSVVGQAAATGESAPAAQQGLRDEILVTATKRVSSLQDVPISMNLISGKTVAAMSVNDLQELSAYIPNLKIADTSVTTNIYMRGIGSGQDRGFEQSVGLFVDGIYMGRSKQYRAPFLDVQRVEVLRGPQPVMFGKNTTAGAIKIETAKPTPGEQLSAEVSGEYEMEFNGRKISAIVSGSPAPSFGLRLATLYEESDGFATNTYRDIDEPAIEQWIGRLTAVWDPGDGALLTAKFEHVDFTYDGSLGEASTIGTLPSGSFLFDIAAQRLLYGPTGAYALDPDIDDKVNFRRSTDAALGEQGSDQKANNVAVTLDYPIGAQTLTAVFGYSEYEYSLSNDIDWLPVPLTQGELREDFDQTSFELRLASELGGTFDYLAGLYWQKNDLAIWSQNTANFEYLGPLVPLPGGPYVISSLNQGVNYGLDVDTISAFAQVTWNVTEAMRFNLGGRYGEESKEVDRTTFCNKLDGSAFNPTSISDVLARGSGLCPSLPTFSDDRDEDHFMPSVQFQWTPSDALMAYAKWDRSYKSGGFNAAALATLADIEYEEERATGVELGLKSTLAEGAAVLNVALFDTHFDDLQVTTLTGGGQALLSNAGKSISRGVEVEGTWLATDAFRLGGSLAYLDSFYDEYEDGPCNAVQRSANVGSGVPCFQDLSGRPTSYAPKWAGYLFGDFGFILENGMRLGFRGDIVYSDHYYYDTDLDPNTRQESYWKFDVRLSLTSADDRWSIALLGKNLTNEAIAVWGTDVPLILGSYVAFTELPRTITLQGEYRFGPK